jgi:hypothetical protein
MRTSSCAPTLRDVSRHGSFGPRPCRSRTRSLPCSCTGSWTVGAPHRRTRDTSPEGEKAPETRHERDRDWHTARSSGCRSQQQHQKTSHVRYRVCVDATVPYGRRGQEGRSGHGRAYQPKEPNMHKQCCHEPTNTCASILFRYVGLRKGGWIRAPRHFSEPRRRPWFHSVDVSFARPISQPSFSEDTRTSCIRTVPASFHGSFTHQHPHPYGASQSDLFS